MKGWLQRVVIALPTSEAADDVVRPSSKSFVVHRSSFVVRRSSFVVRRSSFVVRRSSSIVRSLLVGRQKSAVVRWWRRCRCMVFRRVFVGVCLLVGWLVGGAEGQLL